MDAPRLSRSRAIYRFVVCGLFALLSAQMAHAASARTQNFIVSAPTQELATEIAKAAENFRRDLAQEWLGKELPNWEQPCPITAQVNPNMGAGGATSFMFGNGRPHGWTMSVQGSRERVLDSVLPHEVTHTIFATHFGRPLPRWADEGACTTVEHASERGKQEKLLYQFLSSNRGIAFNKMFAMKEYPRDILPLYSQGYALARFLIALEGKRTYVNYVGAGMESNNWTAATKEYYGFHSLSDLQLSWLEWVRQGTPKIADASEVKYLSTDASLNGLTLADVSGKGQSIPANAVAQLSTTPLPDLADKSNRPPARPLATPLPSNDNTRAAKPNDLRANPSAKRLPANYLPGSTARNEPRAHDPRAEEPSDDEPRPSGEGWYARRREQARARDSESVAMQPASYTDDSSDHFTSASRPQPPEQVRQTILEWKKEERALAPIGE